MYGWKSHATQNSQQDSLIPITITHLKQYICHCIPTNTFLEHRLERMCEIEEAMLNYICSFERVGTQDNFIGHQRVLQHGGRGGGCIHKWTKYV